MSTSLGIVGIVFVAAVAWAMAVRDRTTLEDEANDHAQQTAAFLADQAQRLFEVADIVLHATTTTLGTLDWTTVAGRPDVIATLRRIDDLLPYVDSVFGADITGAVRITTVSAPPNPYSVADRSVFAAARDGAGDQLVIGEPIVGRASHRPTFLLARRRATSDGKFDGIVGAAMSLTYFTDYWRTVDKRNDERIALMRGDDGAVLARFPDARVDGEDRIGRSLVAAAEGDVPSGLFSPGPHLYGSYHRVGALPVYVAVVYSDANLNERWQAALRGLAVPTGLSIFALLVILALVNRLAHRDERARLEIETARAKLGEANAELGEANARLENRVAERTAELVESNKEIQRFAYIVSHDLRSPLVNIVGFSRELQGCFAQILEATSRGDAASVGEHLRHDIEEAFSFIASSADRMDRLIKAILTLSRQGQRTLKPEAIDMTALVRSVVDGVAHRVQLAGAVVDVGPLPDIAADRISVEQVFANLIDNAVKYLRSGVPGVIRVGGRRVTAAAVFTVEDNGRGIGPADRDRVFELFRRAGRQDQPGEGIGLAHVRSLVRRLQGTIVVEGQEGAGSVFTVTLPLVAAPEP